MANVFFNIKVTWATVTDDIRVSVYNPLDLNTPIASQQQNAPHIDQQFSFPGLPRQNFVYKVLQCEIGGSTVIAQLGQASFVPANDELGYKKPILIQCGVDNIPGTEDIWPSGVNTVNIADWIGWELEASGRPGQYPFKRDEVNQLDISWDSVTGDLTLNMVDDVFQYGEYLYFEFQPIISESSGGVGSGTGSGFSDILEVTDTTTLAAGDIGKKILINPSGNYLEITLPDYLNVEASIITFFEMVSSAAKCARIKTFSGQTIAWLETLSDLYICPSESFELYKRVVSTGVYQWRVQNAVGNFLNAGEFVYSDLSQSNVFNLIEAIGANLDYQQYARLYNRRVIRGGDGITYASWSSANIFTRMKFSLKDTGSNNFRIPDMNTTPVYMRPNNSNDAGDFVSQSILQHQHALASNISTGMSVFPWGYYTSQVNHIGKYTGEGNYYPDMSSRAMQFNTATGLWEIIDGSENNPHSRATHVYIRI